MQKSNSLPLEKGKYYSINVMIIDTKNDTIQLTNVMILIKSVWNKDKKNYYYNVFPERASNELPTK